MGQGQAARQEQQIKLEPMNKVALAGIVRQCGVDRKRGYLMIEFKPKEKWVVCTVYDDEQLLAAVEKISPGDFIDIRGFVRPWSKKLPDDTWENHQDVRIERIHLWQPGKRSESQSSSKKSAQSILDDDIPF